MKRFTRPAAAALIALGGSAGLAAAQVTPSHQVAPSPPQPARPAVPQVAPHEGLATGRIQSPTIDPRSGLRLNEQQRVYIRDAVMKDRSKVKPPSLEVDPAVGASLPPSLELYYLPDAVLANVPNAKLYRYTIVHDRVLIADPTKMQVIDVIRP